MTAKPNPDPTGTNSEVPVVRDRRKIDPLTGQVRSGQTETTPATGPDSGHDQGSNPDQPTPPASAGDDQMAAEVVAAAELIAAQAELEERTEALARVQADYVNYRRRVERDSALAGELGRAEVLAALMGVLDDIDAARTAEALTGPFAAVAEKLETTLAKYELTRFGQVGEPFDPQIHEALMHQTRPDATGPTISLVLQPGYRVGERVLRPARVGVSDAE